MKHAVLVGALVLGYLAGTLAPRASADLTYEGSFLDQLKGIKSELAGIRRAIERAK